MVLFPLRVEPYVIRTMEIGDAPSSFDTAQWEELRRRVVADAEKAFVHLLDPQYNVVKFAGYPAGTDGLAASDYERRGFSLVENFTFRTETQTFYGSGNPELRLFDNYADMLFTDGKYTELRVGPMRTDAAGPGPDTL